MRKLSPTELTQIAGGRRAPGLNREAYVKPNSVRPMYGENDWLFGGGSYWGWNFNTNIWAPPIPGAGPTYGVDTNASGFGVYVQDGGFLGELSYNPSSGVYSGSVTDTFNNGIQVSATVGSNHTADLKVTIPFN